MYYQGSICIIKERMFVIVMDEFLVHLRKQKLKRNREETRRNFQLEKTRYKKGRKSESERTKNRRTS